MDRLHLRPFAHSALGVALVLGAALSGIAVVELVVRLTGQFATAILVLPVIVAAWFGGLLVGTVTIALQTALAVFLLPSVFTVGSPDEVIRLTASVAVSLCAMFIMVGVRNIERQFRAVVDLASEGIWTVDEKGGTTYVNPRMADMLGYTPAEMRGRRFSEFVPPAGIPPVEAGFRQLMQNIPERSECELVRKDGSTVWVHYAATPLSDGSRFVGALAVVADISERKRHEVTILRQSEALERANRQKEDFLAMLGHELRNPLPPLVTAVRLMELKRDGSFQRERAVIVRQAEQIARLVDDISDVSRFMRGKLHIRCETVNVAEVVRDVSDSLSSLFARNRHTLDVDVPDGLVVEGDKLRLRQVLVNLLANAAKYTPSGGRVAVTAKTDGDHVVIHVRDNGVGIPPDFLPVLFEPFTQKRETLDRSEGGLGLGLSIVQGIVQAHGGTIEARSAGVGQGSEFIVRLPVVLPDTAAVVDRTEMTTEPQHVAETT